MVNNNNKKYCLFMLVHSPLMLSDATFDVKNESVNVEVNINKCCRSVVNC